MTRYSKRCIALTLPIIFLASSVLGETVVYGIEIPAEIERAVDDQANMLHDDTAFEIYRSKTFEPYKKALRESQKEEAIRDFEHRKFPTIPKELITRQRQSQHDYERVRKESLFEITTTFDNVVIDPLEPKVYEIPVTQGEPSSLLFFDVTGGPWQVKRAKTANGGRLTAEIVEAVDQGNELEIEIDDNFVSSNVIVRLRGYPGLLTFRFKANDTVSQAVTNIRLPLRGPSSNDELSLIGPGIQEADCKSAYDFGSGFVPIKKRIIDGLSGVIGTSGEYTYFKSPHRIVEPMAECHHKDSMGNYIGRFQKANVNAITVHMDTGAYETFNVYDSLEAIN